MSSPKYTVQLVSTELKPTPIPVNAPKRNNSRGCNEPQATRSLLLLLQEHLTPTDDNIDKKVLVTALEAYEYHYNDDDNSMILYISKVDTTGFQKPVSEGGTKSLTKTLVSGFLSYYATQLKHLTIKLHLFARAQPQYFFTKSAKNPAKHLLNDVQLIRWWKTLLQQLFVLNDEDGDNSNNNDNMRWFLIPGVVSEHEAQLLIKDPIVSPSETDSKLWTYGYPYPDSAIAGQVIPRFEGDPKLRFFETLEDSEYQKNEKEMHIDSNDDDEQTNFTVKEFWEMISFTSEFNSGKNSAFFWVYFGGSAQRRASSYTATTDNSKDPILQSTTVTANEKLGGLTLTDVKYNSVISSLEHLEFFPLDVAINSTNTFTQLLGERYLSEAEIEFTGKLNDSVPDQKKTSNILLNQSSSLSKVNNLQMFIKRNKPTTPTEQQPNLSKAPSSHTDIFDSQLSATSSVDTSKESLEKTESSVKRAKKSDSD
ncbi:196_t:CDS:2 [Ambispora gerdemannii]|uniref:histone acetyltransferase n=1 Tax=Ambispora gerdemannii TaxID=144530 RepID=A0A9N8Z6U0_9GLOM|nr:196_t:CDS:2 [Ambispora gerdemannii]